MKNIKSRKYTISLLVCFFALFAGIITANADEKNAGYLTKNQTTFTVGSNEYIDMVCTESGSNNLEIQNSGGTSLIKYTKPGAQDSTVTVSCKWSGKTGMSKSGGGEAVYKFQLENDESVTHVGGQANPTTMTISMYAQQGITEEIDLAQYIGGNISIVSTSFQTGGEFISFDGSCSGSSCKIKPSDEALAYTTPTGLNTKMEITYTRSGDSTQYKVVADITIVTFNYTNIFPGSSGTCNFGGWTAKTFNHQTFYTKTGSNITLPSCTSNSDLLEFGGWRKTAPGVLSNAYTGPAGSCSDAVKDGNGEANSTYVACYERKTTVQIAWSRGILPSGTGWTNDTSNSAYFAGGTTATLPNITGVEGFKGWVTGTMTEPLPAGTQVPVDGKVYYSVIETTTVYRDVNKTVREGKTTSLIVDGMTSCRSSNDSLVTASYIGGDECQIGGQGATSNGETVNIIVETSEGTITYNFQVIPTSTDVSGGDFFIDTTPNLVYGENYLGNGEGGSSTGGGGTGTGTGSGGTSVQTGKCNTFKIIYAGSTKNENYFFGSGDKDSKGHNGIIKSTGYSVEPIDCEGTYYAYCLDPGRPGPDSGDPIVYQVYENDLSQIPAVKGVLAAVMEQYPDFTSIATDNDDSRKIAIHHSIRIAAIIGGVDGGGVEYILRHKYYENTANAIKNCGTDESCIVNAINDNFTKYSLSERADIISKMAHIIASSYSYQDLETEIENEVNPGTPEVTGTVTTIEAEGTIKLPAAMTTTPTIEPCGSNQFGITCQVLEALSCSLDAASGMNLCTYKVKVSRDASTSNKQTLPQTAAEKKSVSFKIKYNGSDITKVHLAVAQTNPEIYQRMVVINTGDTDAYVYIPVEVDCSQFNYESYASHPEDFDKKDEFVAAGCCAEITNESAYGDFLDVVCGDICTTSTLPQVCNIEATAGTVDLYTIKEAYLGGKKQIGKCVVNVKSTYSDATRNNFLRFDDVGNVYNVEEFKDNQFCEVTCKEDWQIAMEAYGSFVGENAVAAGTYFRVKSDIFIGGKRECYTTYIDYASFVQKMSEKSKDYVDKYNEYSTNSHIYTDIYMQKYENKKVNVTNQNHSYCLEYNECDEGYSPSGGLQCKEDDPPSTCCSGPDDEVCNSLCEPDTYDVSCKTTGSTNGYTLKTGNPDTGEQYIKNGSHSTELDLEWQTKTENQTVTDGTDTEKRLLNQGSSTNKTYSASLSFDCTATENQVPGGTASLTGCSYGNHCKTNHSEYGDFCVDGDEGKKEWDDQPFQILSRKMLDDYERKAEINVTELNAKLNAMYSFDAEFFKCQHFELYNSDGSNEIYKYDRYVLGSISDNEVQYQKVTTLFKPGATYTYADQAYMTLLGSDNILEMYQEQNDKELGTSYSGAKDAKKSTTLHNVNTTSGAAEDQEVDIARNYLMTSMYRAKSDKKWDAAEGSATREYALNYDDPTEGNKLYGSENKDCVDCKNADTTEGKSLPDDTTAEFTKTTGIVEGKIVLCEISGTKTPKFGTATKKSNWLDFEDLTEKLVVSSNSDSIYWQSGSCFEVTLRYRDVNYVKASMENSSFYKNKGYWWSSNSNGLYVAHGDTLEDAISKLKSKANGTIPDSTKYWEKSAKINMFPVSLSTPRNMYTYTYAFGDIGMYTNGKTGRIMGGEKPIIEANKRTCFYEVYEEVCLCCGADDYDFDDGSSVNPKEVLDGQYNFSDDDKIKNNEDGVVAMIPSTVQLSDFSGGSGRTLASNWDESTFFYDGLTYKTDKGKQLLSVLESKGENIYSKNDENNYNLEYSFTLVPSTIAAIRDYNETYGYEINVSRLHLYGRYYNADSDGSLTTELDLEDDYDTISFIHYGSLFLETVLPSSAVNTSLASRGNSVCAIESVTEANIKAKMNSGCRWVDFIGPANKLSTISIQGETEPTKFRMAFK